MAVEKRNIFTLFVIWGSFKYGESLIETLRKLGISLDDKTYLVILIQGQLPSKSREVTTQECLFRSVMKI